MTLTIGFSPMLPEATRVRLRGTAGGKERLGIERERRTKGETEREGEGRRGKGKEK